MARANTVLLNASGGEISPELYARLDLPIYQRGNQRIQNYIVLSQGGAQYRNGFAHVHNTRGLAAGRLIPFAFSEQDTYVIEMTEKKMRFYRNFGTVLNSTTLNITGITNANPAVVTSAAHGLTNGTEIFINGIVGMKELNGQFFVVSNAATNTFELKDVYGNNVTSSAFAAYVSGGTINSVYSLDTPYLAEHLNEIHIKQSADTIILTHQKYAPYKLTRTAHTSWTLRTFSRGTLGFGDPFNQRELNGISKANPGVFQTSISHTLAVDDEVYIAEIGGMVEVTDGRYLVNTVPSSSQFTLKSLAGTPLNTTSFTTYTSGGIVIPTKNCPKTSAFIDSARLVYGNWPANPAGLAFSRSPDSSTGATRFDDFTTGTDATHAVLYTLSTIFDRVDSIQWIANLNRQVVVGCLSSVRRIHGTTIDDPISPSSINAKPINSIGVAPIQPFSSGQSMFYVDRTGRRVQNFLFAFQSNDFVTANQHLAANQLCSSNFLTIVQQRGDSGLLWVLREDGVLTGLTFNELESIFGWHRHYIGGQSVVNSVNQSRAKVLSITVEPRLNQESVLWAIIERKVGSNTYRSVEYLKEPVRFVEPEDFFTGHGFTAQKADITRYANATYEQLKDSVHLDSTVSYDGSALSTTISMTPNLTTGDMITITASAAFFNDSHVGRQIWKKYDSRGYGGGRAQITGIVSSTQVQAKVLSAFDTTSTIPAGSWLLTTNKVNGLLHLAGATVDLQLDGAPGGTAVVASDGSVTLSSETSKAHVGFHYPGLLMTLNLDVAGQRGSAGAKVRKIVEVIPRFHNSVGARIGSTIWNTDPIVFKVLDDLTDRPTPLFSGVQHQYPKDSYTRQTKQVVLMQDIPSPQTLLSLDIMVETADP
jgi:hypothetical protein